MLALLLDSHGSSVEVFLLQIKPVSLLLERFMDHVDLLVLFFVFS